MVRYQTALAATANTDWNIVKPKLEFLSTNMTSLPQRGWQLRRFASYFVSSLAAGLQESQMKPTRLLLVTVQAKHPEIGEISEHIVADATLSPVAQAAISPKITAPVRTFYVQRGSKVKAGQLLAVLENRDLSAQALDNKGQYTAAQASFDMQTKAQVPEDYHKAELDVAQAKAQLELQKQIVAARQKLLGGRRNSGKRLRHGCGCPGAGASGL